MSGSHALLDAARRSPRADGLRAPARTERHERTLVAWPTRRPIWGAHRARAIDEYRALIEAIARFELVTVVADPALAGEALQALAGCTGADVLELPIDDSWIRDSGPIYLVDGDGDVSLVQLRFNSWGEKYLPYDDDARLPERLAALDGLRRYESPLVMEGGGFTVDGEGTLITTESVVLNPNRNPGWTRAECEHALREATGAERVVWLEHGLVEDRDTDGHSDNVVQFVAPRRVIAQVAPDRSNPNWGPLRDNAARLRAAGLEVIELPQLPYTEPIDGQRFAVPYVNFYPVNGAVIVPQLDAPDEQDAYATLAAALPGREVVGVPSAMLAYGGGGVGCVTQQVPAAGARS